MNILCLNTAFPEAHIALSYAGKDYFEKIDSNSKHSENLLVAIENLFERVIKTENLKIDSHDFLKLIEIISVIIGPGSFTGLRISIATAKAILITNPKIKIIPINSLELIASEFLKEQDKKILTPIIDALSGLFFIAQYDNKLGCIAPPQMINDKDLKNYKNLISNDISLVKKSNFCELTPETMLDLTKQKVLKNVFIKENELIPLYLRPSQAEAELKKCK